MTVIFGQEHVDRYRETDGEEGYIWREGSTILLLTTTGRRTGNESTTPLIYQLDGDNPVIVASKGGSPEHPGWYENLMKTPEVSVQIKADTFRVRARVAAGQERERLWGIEPIPFDPRLLDLAEESVRAVSGTSHRLPSGPLHDAAEVARAGIPTVMVFVQSLRGLSHTKLEDTKEEHLELAVRALDTLTTKTLEAFA